jgi:predicted nucleic acid-binding protein
MIVDTDVLIDYFRGSEKAKLALTENLPFKISAVTLMELIQGSKDKQMSRLVERQLKAWKVRTLHTTEAISTRAVQYVREFSLSHAVQMADALIAATAIEEGEPLLTGNEKHFTPIPSFRLHVGIYRQIGVP